MFRLGEVEFRHLGLTLYLLKRSPWYIPAKAEDGQGSEKLSQSLSRGDRLKEKGEGGEITFPNVYMLWYNALQRDLDNEAILALALCLVKAMDWRSSLSEALW